MAVRETTCLTLDDLKTWCKVTPGQAKPVSSLSAAGGIATAVINGHGFRNQDTVVFAGATPTDYNGAKTVSVLDGNTVTFAITGAPSSPATGTITARSDQDALLTLIADRVSEGLERATSRVFRLRTDLQETLNGSGRRALVLRYFPIVTLTSVAIDGTAVDPSLYVIDADRAMVMMKNGAWPAGVGNITAAYSAGYAADALPADVTGTALDVAAFLYSRHTAGGVLASSINIGPSGISIQQGLPRDLRDAIARLRDTRFG